MSSIFLYLYSLFLFFGQNVCIHTKIAKYWFSEDECGISRDSQLMDNSCFDKHMSEEQSGMIRWGRHARGGEFPWILKLYAPVSGFSCTTSIINRYWIITAAHCFNVRSNPVNPNHPMGKPVDAPLGGYVYPLKTKLLDKSLERNYYLKYVFNHPGYHRYPGGNFYDLALARLETPIDFNKTRNIGYRDLNAICFPQRYAVNNDYELALLVGVGAVVTQNKSESLDPDVWTGWTRMYPLGRDGNYKIDDSGIVIRVRQIIRGNDSSSATCSGDSGSPLVQYVNGRAVVIGINSGSISDKNSEGKDDKCTTEQGESIFARLSRYINWINETITTGERWAYFGHDQLPPPNWGQ